MKSLGKNSVRHFREIAGKTVVINQTTLVWERQGKKRWCTKGSQGGGGRRLTKMRGSNARKNSSFSDKRNLTERREEMGEGEHANPDGQGGGASLLWTGQKQTGSLEVSLREKGKRNRLTPTGGSHGRLAQNKKTPKNKKRRKNRPIERKGVPNVQSQGRKRHEGLT